MLFRGAKMLTRTYREKILSLVMLPAFFLATLPHTACICADGHREPSCQAAVCRSLAKGSSMTACCGCTCCSHRGSNEPRSCCQAKQKQQSSSDHHPISGSAVAAKGCCKPFVESPAPAAVAAKGKLVSELTLAAVALTPTTMLSASELWPTFERPQQAMPPPLDAVIVFQHLTI